MFSCDNTAFITVPSKKNKIFFSMQTQLPWRKNFTTIFLQVIRTEDFCITSHPPVLTPPTPYPLPPTLLLLKKFSLLCLSDIVAFKKHQCASVRITDLRTVVYLYMSLLHVTFHFLGFFS